MARNTERPPRRAKAVPAWGRSRIPGERGRQGSEKGLSHQPLRDWIAAKRPVWRFTILLFTGLTVFYVGYALFSQSRYMEGVLRLTASISAAALSALGQEARADGALVIAPAFAFQVVGGCDGLEPVGFLLAVALATPTAVKIRGLFALVGTGFLLILNLVRLVSLGLVGAYFPGVTNALHWNAWPAFTIVVVVLLWICWVRRVRLTGHAFA